VTGKYAAYTLYNKMANTYADLPRDVIKNSSIFKNLVAGDTMNAERISASTISDFKNNNIHLFQQQEQEQEQEEEQRHHDSISSSREQD